MTEQKNQRGWYLLIFAVFGLAAAVIVSFITPTNHCDPTPPNELPWKKRFRRLVFVTLGTVGVDLILHLITKLFRWLAVRLVKALRC